MIVFFALAVQAIAGALVIAGWRRARAGARAAESLARSAGEPSYTQVGGARLDLFNATIPFAQIVATPSKLTLVVLGREYVFEREQVGVSRHRGFLSTGLHIEHARPDVPSFVVFWTTDFRKLARALQRFGYAIEAA